MDNTRKPSLLRFTLIFIYKNLYVLGITLLRRRLRMRRRIRKFFLRLRGSSLRWWEKSKEAFSRFRRRLIQRIAAPFVRLGTVRSQMRPIIERSKQDGKIPIQAYFNITLTFFRLLFTILRTLFNYAVPIVAAVLLIHMIDGRMNQPFGLDVYYKDARIGFIETESDFEAASRIIKERYIASDTSALIATPYFVVREAKQGETYTSQKELANRILATSQDIIVNAYGFYVDDRFYGAVRDSGPLIDELDAILEEAYTGGEDEQVSFAKRIRLDPGVYPLSSIVDQKSLKAKIRSFETVDEIYTVEYGDSPSLIATKTGLSYDSIVALNPFLEETGLLPGQQLLLNQARPFMSVMNTYTTVYEEEVPYEVEEVETSTYVKGYRMPSVKGQPGLQRVTAAISTVNGVEVSREILDRVLLRAPVTEKVIVGTNDPRNIVSSGARVNSSGFMWPTQGGVINVGLGGYPGHTGVDIPRPAGTPIFAAAAGRVVRVVHSGVGYGRYVIIDHGNGFSTLYAHASAIHVTVGQYVNQGDVIASVGRTGNSTGNHLHFEVRYKGQIMNPRNYIG
jgi:murein DD-endopeptidase MepM/ murein hydrolase activator NlpD